MKSRSSTSVKAKDFVSVIIPTFNAQEYLLLLLESLSNQSVKDFEVIVVDDGSNDGTRESVAQVMERYPVLLRYYYLDNTDIFGAGIARNYGTKHAKGNILLFLDQDCVADRELIKKHIHQHRSKDIILGYYAGYGNEQECYDLAELKAHVRGEEPIRVIQEFRDQLFRDKDNKEAWKCFVSAHFSIKKNIFCDYYFDESFTRWGCEDVDLGYRLFLKEKAIHFVRECVVYNSSKAPKRTKKKFLSLARSLVEMYAKHRTKTMKLYCFERFYHTPVQYRGLLQLVFRNDGFVLEELKTEIDIKSDCTVRIVPGRDFSKVSPTIEEIVPLIRNAHFEVDILKNLKGRALAEFRGCFHRLIKILRDHKKGINFEDIRRQSFLVGTRLLGPRNLSIDFHNRCNIRCLFCSINSPLMEKKKHVPVFLNLKFVKKILEQAYEMGVEKIRVSSDGEPLISKDAIAILKIIARKGFELQLLTNGTALKEKHLVSLSQVCKASFLVNFSAAKKATYQKIHGGHADNYNFVLDALSLLSRFKQEKGKNHEEVRIMTTYIITKLNYREISDYISLVKRTGVDNVYFKFAILYEEAEDLLIGKEEMRILKKELLKAKLTALRCSLATNLNELLSNISDGGFQIRNDIKQHSLNLPVSNCYNAWFFGRVNPFGDYYICCRETIPVGNVREKDFKDIFFSRRMKNLMVEGASGISLEKKMWSKCNYCYHLHENRTAKRWFEQR